MGTPPGSANMGDIDKKSLYSVLTHKTNIFILSLAENPEASGVYTHRQTWGLGTHIRVRCRVPVSREESCAIHYGQALAQLQVLSHPQLWALEGLRGGCRQWV